LARILGAIASSHTPTIGFAFDTGRQKDPAWQPIFAAYEPVRQWLKEKQPDVLLYIFNDHVTSFFFDHYSAFSLGVGETYPVADEGAGARDLPALRGDPAPQRLRAILEPRWWQKNSTCPSSRTKPWITAASHPYPSCGRITRIGPDVWCRCK
jgi:hypothetical protein